MIFAVLVSVWFGAWVLITGPAFDDFRARRKARKAFPEGDDPVPAVQCLS